MITEPWYGDEGESGQFVPLYVLVNGRTSPRTTSLDLATQVISLPVDPGNLEPEYEAVFNHCWTWVSIAEIGAHLRYPLTLTKVLVDVLVERGFLSVGSQAEETIADRGLLETILAGLENL